ncbi:hypothetical protein QQ045_002499 [Rhodiola kirilowii]
MNNDKEKKMKEFNRSATMKSSSNNNNENEMTPTKNPLRAISPTKFKRKAQQLGKQTYELATLCDIPACLVVQKPDDDDKVYTWPNSIDEVKSVVGVYNATVSNGNRPTAQVSKPDGRSMELFTANERKMLVSAVDAKIDDLKAKIEAAKHGQKKKDSCDLAGTGRGHGFELENQRSKKPVNECGMLLNAVDAKIEAIKAGRRKKDSCDEAGIGGGHGFARFLVDERLKKLTAAQVKDLVTELDSKIESLANKIARPTFPPEASTRGSIDQLPDLNL